MTLDQPLLAAYRDPALSEGSDMHDEKFDTNGLSSAPRRSIQPMLLLSIFFNIILTIYMALRITRPDISVMGVDYQESEFAGLTRSIPKQWNGNTATTQEDWNELWDSTPFWPGIISLPDAYARAKGLPRAQRFPWDPEKGIYVINAYHNLHCVLNVRQSLEEFREGRSQSIAWPHIQHCLLVLRDEIMCDADDTPRYTGFQRWGSSGYGQTRMCRNWTQLEEWATQTERESCWRNAAGVLGDRPNATSRQLLDRYRYCGDGSPYKEMAKTAWKNPAEWRGLDQTHTVGEARAGDATGYVEEWHT